MKKCLLLIVFFGALANSQSNTANNQLYIVSNYGMLKTIPQGQLQAIYAEGSPYISKAFQNGKIINVETGNEENARLRYDVVKNSMQIRIGNTNMVRFLPKDENIAYSIGNQKFIYREFRNNKGNKVSGYFEEIYKNDKIKLLGSYEAEIIPAQIAVSGYEKPKEARIDLEKRYYILNSNGTIEEVKLRKNNVRNVLNSKKVESFLDSNELRNENDLIRLLNHIHC